MLLFTNKSKFSGYLMDLQGVTRYGNYMLALHSTQVYIVHVIYFMERCFCVYLSHSKTEYQDQDTLLAH